MTLSGVSVTSSAMLLYVDGTGCMAETFGLLSVLDGRSFSAPHGR